jgi:hypothetical protein
LPPDWNGLQVAFQTDQRAVYRSWFLPLDRLEIGAIASERWGGNGGNGVCYNKA